ncbi:hypothetical protein SSP35_18_00500 [Streptomyces sp. NBRC 110611]|uniref:FG-GAP repeat domain-containing protein n=1 Tax=Streptomyces sp. NBRC 110611 TaxID=1621259 RepID=UPI00082BDAD1|nr:VCBS repeat-containing protein [Streptomyces sp. NBRC 110611]GAU70322.1 hypothetical protein SSP35_18_00500 [Streptomyces sp. NBRC 110611]
MASADFNGDGRTDIAAVRKDGSLHAFYAKPDGTLEYGRALWHDRTWGGMRRIVGGDFNGDGIGDLIALWANGELRQYTGTREGHVRARGRIWPDNTWKNVRTFAAMRDDRSGRDGLVAIARDGLPVLLPDAGRRHPGRVLRAPHAVARHFLEADEAPGRRGLPRTAGTGHVARRAVHGSRRVHQGGSFRLYTGSAPGKLSRAYTPLWKDTSWGSRKALLGGDFNGDGKSDVVGIRSDGVPQLYVGDGAGRLSDGKRMN